MTRKTTYRIRRLSKKHGGMKTPLMLKAVSQYLNPKSGSELSLSDQIRFEDALARTRIKIPKLKRTDMQDTLRKMRGSRPKSAMMDITHSAAWDATEGGGKSKKKNRKKTPRKSSKRKTRRKTRKVTKKKSSRGKGARR